MLMLIPAALACIVMMLHISVDVVFRGVLDTTLKGTLDVTSDWWMVTMVFLALAYAQLRNEHVRATVVTELLPDRWQRVAEIATVALMGLFALGLAYFGWTSAMDSLDIGESSDNLRWLPLWPFRFMIPIGCLGLALQCVASIYEIAAGERRESHQEELI